MVKYEIESIGDLPKGARYAAWECKIDEPAYKWIPMGSVVNGKELLRGRWLKLKDEECGDGPFEAGFLRRERLHAKESVKKEKMASKIEKKKARAEKLKKQLAKVEEDISYLEEEEKELSAIPKSEDQVILSREDYDAIMLQMEAFKKWNELKALKDANDEVEEDDDTEDEI